MHIRNFKRFLNDPLSILKDTLFKTLVRKKKPKATKQTCSYPLLIAVHLTQHLISSLIAFIFKPWGPSLNMRLQYIPAVQAQAIMNNINLIAADKTMNTKLIGGPLGAKCSVGRLTIWLSLSWIEEREAYLLQHKMDMAQQATKKRQKNAAAKAEGKKRAAEETIAANDAVRKAKTNEQEDEYRQRLKDEADTKTTALGALVSLARTARNVSVGPQALPIVTSESLPHDRISTVYPQAIDIVSWPLGRDSYKHDHQVFHPAHQETPKSESEIAVVSTADNSQVQPAESSPAIVTSQPKPSSQPAVTQSSHSEEHHRKTTSDIWAHLVQSGQGMDIFLYSFDSGDGITDLTNLLFDLTILLFAALSR
ncbi:hypothetical protein H4Q26_000451 [Puccinia striiformis f. sp. tritici PST-130]|nr:hypothetical protein H4Q26_000451 [Puccinia striiformis f. sp. tritici PST-130]